MFDSEGWGVNYQMQIVTKLPNENIQNYQLEMFSGRGGGITKCKLWPNYQMKISKTTNLKCSSLMGGGGSVNYQMQIVTKLPNENIQNYQLEMFDSDGGRVSKLPNANCDQTTKWKYPKLPTRNVWFWWVSKLPNANCDQTTK